MKGTGGARNVTTGLAGLRRGGGGEGLWAENRAKGCEYSQPLRKIPQNSDFPSELLDLLASEN